MDLPARIAKSASRRSESFRVLGGSREGRGVVSRRRNGGTRHFAVVVVHRLELRTREVARSDREAAGRQVESLVVAMRHHAVLVKLKEEDWSI